MLVVLGNCGSPEFRSFAVYMVNQVQFEGDYAFRGPGPPPKLSSMQGTPRSTLYQRFLHPVNRVLLHWPGIDGDPQQAQRTHRVEVDRHP